MISFKSGSGSSMFIYMFSKQLYKKSTFIILSGSKFFKPKHYFSSFFIRGKENIIQIKLFYHSKISRELIYLDNHKVHLCKLRRVLTKGQKTLTQNIKFQFYYHFKFDTLFPFFEMPCEPSEICTIHAILFHFFGAEFGYLQC